MKRPYENEFFVAGAKFHKFKDVQDILEEGMNLTLIPEPSNKFDKCAVMIKYNNIMLGYVPMKNGQSKEVSELFESGAELKATITDLAPDFEPWKALKVKIEEVQGIKDA